MSGFRKDKPKDEGKSSIPSLTVEHYREISDLYRKYGKKMHLLLTYWKTAKFGSGGRLIAILDWSTASEQELAVYENFQPLKGIRYMGQGYLTYTPYTWAQEWLRQWEWWLTTKASDADKHGILTKRAWKRPVTPSPSQETKKIQAEIPSDTSAPSATNGEQMPPDTWPGKNTSGEHTDMPDMNTTTLPE